MAIKKQSVKQEKPSPLTTKGKLKAIIQIINVQDDVNMTRIYSATLPVK